MKPITSMLLTLIVLTVGPLAYFKWGGQEYLASMGSPKSDSKINRDVVYAPVTTDQKVKVYKWKDENGVWQFGSIPPNGVSDIQVMNLQPNVNIMKPVDVPVAEEEIRSGGVITMTGESKNGSTSKDPLDALENPYAPENVADLIKNTQNIQNMLDSRQQAQENALKAINRH